MLRLEIRLVEYFLAVVDHGTVTRAAERLYVAQPSVSQAIRTLETDLGVALFKRLPRGLRLTADGEAFVEPARRLLADVDFAAERVHAVRNLTAGRIKVAALSSLAADPLSSLLSEFHSRWPDVTFEILDPGSPELVAEAVRRGKAEVGLTNLTEDTTQLRSIHLGEQELAIVLPPGLAAGVPDPVPWAAAAKLPMAVEIADRHTIGDGHASEAMTEVVVECAHRQAVWELVRAGAAATVLPRAFASSHLDGVSVRPFAPPITRPIGWVFRQGPLSPAAAVLLGRSGARPSPSGPAPPSDGSLA